MTFWVVAGMLFMSLAIPGNSMQQTKGPGASTDVVRMMYGKMVCRDGPRDKNGLRHRK